MGENAVTFLGEKQNLEQQLEATSPAPDRAQQKQETAGLSAAQVLEMIQQGVEKGIESLNRKQQSERDKLEARIQKKLGEFMTTAERTGIKLTQEQQTQLRNVAAEQIQAETATTVQPNAPQTEAPTPDNDSDAQAAYEYMKQSGIELLDTDPEAKGLDQITDPKRWSEAVIKGVDAKKARTAKERLPVMGSMGGVNPHQGKTALQIFSDVYRNK